MNFYHQYAIIEGDPFLANAKGYRTQRHEWLVAWSEVARKFGAVKIPEVAQIPNRGLIFDTSAVPDGWTKPVSRGFSRPKKGHPDADLLASLPGTPNAYLIFRGHILDTVAYDYPDGSAVEHVGPFRGPQIGWAGETYYVLLGDPVAAAKAVLQREPKAVITNGALDWQLPKGLRKVSKAQIDLIVAQHEVDREEAREAGKHEDA